ncbi:MAG: creatininase family protein [Armatimonadetes bacterium]|nr:creatininase family protein [Armatimonadota bacterium]
MEPGSSSLNLADLTWKDVARYLERSDALIIPMGTCEQHGLHLPLSTDSVIAEAFARAISEQTGVLVAPTLAYGVNLPCDRFMSGTAGFTFDSLRAFVEEILTDWTRHRFRRFFIVTAHACAMDGYGFAHHEAVKQGALPLLERGDCTVSVLFPYWTEIGDILESQASVEHACEAETSLMLLIRPEIVLMGLARGAPEEQDGRFAAFPEGVATGPPRQGWSGAEGHPEAASAEKGLAIFERCLNPMVRHVSDMVGKSQS